MAFYDLTKDGVLRPEELFKYRLKRDSSIPSRGGQKEFEPDGSWLQNKRLESFLQEKTTILSEPRVEKLKNIVEGTWNAAKKLIDLKKPRKFWMHMGFTDERRNWLYPEEALFLMETNTLELNYNDRPMSIQEAYVKLLGHGICLEEYQVFSHLRRLGYIVLRHEEERIFTDYERRINLHEYVDKKTRKERLEREKGTSNKKSTHSSTGNNIDEKKEGKITSSSTSEQPLDISNESKDETLNGSSEASSISDVCAKRILDQDMETGESPLKKAKFTSESDETNSEESSDFSNPLFYNVSSWAPCFKKQSPDLTDGVNGESNQSQSLHQTVMDLDSQSLFPDIAQCSLSDLKTPPLHLLPSDLGVTEGDVDCSAVQLKSSSTNASGEMSVNRDVYKEKVFSCLSAMGKDPKISASSWSEYKRKKSERLSLTSSTTLVDHLWQGSVTPLLNPAQVTSYKDVMDRLQIIKSADSEDLIPDVSSGNLFLSKVCFDVHLPDHSFKKTMPGVPDHRVCVTRSDGVPPGLDTIQHFSNKFKDNVPLHWAVVDSGEIAFFVFDNTRAVEVLSA